MSQDILQNNKRIAKNTIVLYVRMLFMMFIGLFTSRIILQALGISDLGLVNVTGGVVGMFTFLNGTFTSGTQRFITYAIGEGNMSKLKKVFKTAMTMHVFLSIIIVLLCETVGLWYMYNKLNVESGRFEAALWCFHLSVLSCGIGIVQMPFMAALIAHEKMATFAYMSILDAVCTLMSAYFIMIVPYDRVVFYCILGTFFAMIKTYIYNWYCRKHFEECSFSFGFDKDLFKNMLSFSGWNALGCLAAMGQSTGINLVLNLFCGTIVNGARGIAFQANGWISKFVDNFQMALNPQITKYYAEGDIENMSNLVIRGALISSFLLLFLGVPLFIEIEWVVTLWLGQCPDYVPIFLRVVMIETLFRTMGNPTITAMHATGQMKMVNLTVGVILLIIVPMSYSFFKIGWPVEWVVAVNVVPWVIVPFIRLYWVNKYCNGKFPIKRYLTKAYLRMPVLAILMYIFPYMVKLQFPEDDVVTFIVVGCTSVITSAVIIYFFAMDEGMKCMSGRIILKICNRITRKN